MSGYYAFDTLVYSISVTPPVGHTSAICTGVASLVTGDEVTGFTAQDDALDLADFAGVTATIPLPDGTGLSLAASELTPRLACFLWDDKAALVLTFQRQVIDGSTTTIDTALIVVAGAPLPAFATPDELMNFMFVNPPLPASMVFPEVTELSYADFDLSQASAAGDTLLGTALGETLAGLAGDDLIQALAGDDMLIGGAGNDTLEGGDGADTLDGGTGDDVLRGGLGNVGDVITGGDGTDTLDYSDLTLGYTMGGLTVDLATGTTSGSFYVGADTLSGIENADGTGGADTLIGDAGANRLDGREGADSLTGGDGDDTLLGAEGNDTLDGGTGANHLDGGAGDDVLRGGTGSDTIEGGAGNDRLEGTAIASIGARAALVVGGDSLSGGEGNDTLFAILGDCTLSGGAGDDLVQSDTGRDSLSGGDGNDGLYAGAGADWLDGGAGADTLWGGGGNDTYVVDAGDLLIEFDEHGIDFGGTDTVRAGIDYSLAAIDFVEVLILTGTGAIDGTGNALANRITGTRGANVLEGAAGNDTLAGGAGGDTLDGGAGGDLMIGAAGNDLYIVDDATDQVTEILGPMSGIDPGGIDTVQASVSTTLNADGTQYVETLVLVGRAAINGTGNALANTITGNSAGNFLEGGAGNDLITGGAGADTLQGDTGSDRMLGGAGNDLYFVGVASDRVVETTTQSSGIDAGGVDAVVAAISFSLAGSVGLSFVENLWLDGTAANGTGNDLRNGLNGNDAANRLDGGLGADVLYGGAGADSFIFSTALSPSNIDRITDFVSGTDVIRLDGTIFTGLDDGRLAAAALAENLSGRAEDASDRIIYEIDTGRLWFDADGTGAGARVQVAALSAGLDLSNADFVIF